MGISPLPGTLSMMNCPGWCRKVGARRGFDFSS
jgi:hypothetical protein